MIHIPPQYEALSPAKVAKLLKVSLPSVVQQRHRDAGLCRYCNEPAMEQLTVCVTHRQERNRAARQRHGSKPWEAGRPGRPPKTMGDK